MKSGDAEQSIELFESANKRAKKKSPECYLGLSFAKLRLKEFKDAVKHGKKASAAIVGRWLRFGARSIEP